jgi:hypothetical protein
MPTVPGIKRPVIAGYGCQIIHPHRGRDPNQHCDQPERFITQAACNPGDENRETRTPPGIDEGIIVFVGRMAINSTRPDPAEDVGLYQPSSTSGAIRKVSRSPRTWWVSKVRV